MQRLKTTLMLIRRRLIVVLALCSQEKCVAQINKRTQCFLGCYSYDGSDYRGTAAHTEKGVLCIKWTDAPDINPSTYPAAVRKSNHYNKLLVLLKQLLTGFTKCQ